LGDEPLLKLLAEFRAGLKSNDEMVHLQAAEELGYIGDELMKQIRPFSGDNGRSQRLAEALKQARRAIPAACQSEDFVIRSAAIMSSFQLAEPPRLDGTLQILREDPNSFGPAASEGKYGIRDFCVLAVQKRLLQTMDATTRRFVKNLDDGSTIRVPGGRPDVYRGVPGFPYAQFYGQALATGAVLRDTEMRTSIVNVIWSRYEKESVPQMIRLLDDADSHIRQVAVSALNRYINRNFSNGWDRDTFYRHNVLGVTDEKPLEQRQRDYELNEHEYIQYWRDWWREHRGNYENIADGYDAAPSPHKDK
jgi:HEAT repeat protein